VTQPRNPARKILTQTALAQAARKVQSGGGKVVFTNGCFDLLHVGHIRYLNAARRLGDALAVAVNSDASVRSIKGKGRPVTSERQRLEVLASLECVDWVCLFGADTPLALIVKAGPDILVKGGDWPVAKIVGRDAVERSGGKVLSIPLSRGISTTGILRKIRRGRS